MEIANKLREDVSGLSVPIRGEEELSVTLSGGVYVVKCGNSREDVVGFADKALYEAKGSGRNRIVLAE